MSKFLETYGVAIFVLILMAILIAFASPFGLKLKEYTLEKATQTAKIGQDEITVATGGVIRPDEPVEAVDGVYCIYYEDGEMVIAQHEIQQESGRTVIRQGFYSKPQNCTTEMTTVRFEGAVKPISCNNWFGMCTNLTEIKNMENLYTNECTSMKGMFDSCYKLTHLDLRNFVTTKVTNMAGMFEACTSLTSLDLSNFNTTLVTDMSSMFQSCNNLISLDLSNFNTTLVTNMSKMFADCNNLKTIKNINNFKTEKVTDMYKMFYACNSLVNLNISNWKTSTELTTMSEMFSGCNSLTTLDLGGFDTSNVTEMSWLFKNCNNLRDKSIIVSKNTYDKMLNSNIGISIDTLTFEEK